MENTIEKPIVKLSTRLRGLQSGNTKKRSYNAKAVAKEVINAVRTGKKINMQEIQLNNGYSVSSAKSMRAIHTKSYQEEILPVIHSMQSLRDKTLTALHSKDLKEAKIFDLHLLLKTLNHDTQLLQGKSTQNTANINRIIVYGSDDFLAQQLKPIDQPLDK